MKLNKKLCLPPIVSFSGLHNRKIIWRFCVFFWNNIKKSETFFTCFNFHCNFETNGINRGFKALFYYLLILLLNADNEKASLSSKFLIFEGSKRRNKYRKLHIWRWYNWQWEQYIAAKIRHRIPVAEVLKNLHCRNLLDSMDT